MATEREKKLSILLLKERIEHITGKRVILKEVKDTAGVDINSDPYNKGREKYKDWTAEQHNDEAEKFQTFINICRMSGEPKGVIEAAAKEAFHRQLAKEKSQSNELQESEVLEEAKGIESKDWQRMLDLVLSGDSGEKVANSITNKDKAIARFVCGLKLDSVNPKLDIRKNWRDKYEYDGAFSAFGNKALELGATPEEIQAVFDSTSVPEEFTNKQKDLSSKKISTYIGAISKALIKAGYDIEFEKHNGNALTNVGRDAMERNGRKWTIGYKTIITSPTGVKTNLNIDCITDEGGGTTYYTASEIGWKEYGLREFLVSLFQYLQNIDKKSSNRLQEETQVDTEKFTPAKALSDESEPRPNRMKRPGQLKGGWALFSYSKRGGHGGLYIQDECRDMMVDKYGAKGEKVWEGLIDAGTGPFFSAATEVAAEKRWLINELGLTYDPADYWQYSYYSMWKEWMKRIGQPINIKQPVVAPVPSIDPNPANNQPITKPVVTPQVQAKPVSTLKSTIKPDSKDEMRISDIASKAGGNKYKMQSLAYTMADKITDAKKAYRRGLAAEDENYHDLAKIFFDRADQLGLQENVKISLKENYTEELEKQGKFPITPKDLLISLDNLYPYVTPTGDKKQVKHMEQFIKDHEDLDLEHLTDRYYDYLLAHGGADV